MTIYMVAQEQHRIKKITDMHKFCFDIYIMYSMWDQKSVGDP